MIGPLTSALIAGGAGGGIALVLELHGRGCDDILRRLSTDAAFIEQVTTLTAHYMQEAIHAAVAAGSDDVTLAEKHRLIDAVIALHNSGEAVQS